MKAKSIDSAAPFKTSLKAIVEAYIQQHSDEYQLLIDAVAMHRKALADPQFAAMEASPDHRALYEISLTLQEAIISNLSNDGLTWFKSKEGGRWFANEFKEFSLPSSI